MEDIKIKYLLKKLLSGKQKHGALNASCLFFCGSLSKVGVNYGLAN